MTRSVRWTSAAAALLIVNGTVAWAQSQIVLDVPFTFHTANATMAPGKYAIERVPTSAIPYYKIRHESGTTALVMAAQAVQRRSNKAHPEVAFECAGEYCALKAIYPAYDSTGIRVAAKKMMPSHSSVRTEEVRIAAQRVR